MLRADFPRGRRGLGGMVVSATLLAGCSSPTYEPPPEAPPQESWYAFIVQCANCPGLTNPEIDRTVTPHRARLRVGQRTSLRASIRDGCEAPQGALQIVRWTASDPQVTEVEASSSESAIVTALAPGISSIAVERQLPSGALDQRGLKDGQVTSGCAPLPDVVFEIIR